MTGSIFADFRIEPPGADEYAPFYRRYVESVARKPDIREILRQQPGMLESALGSATEEVGLARYQPDKWSVKEALGHVVDSERIFSYRLLRIGRGDLTPLAGYDQDLYVAAAEADRHPLGSFLKSFATARAATLDILAELGREDLERRGNANEHPVTARALVFIIAGHVEHHFNVLRDRYHVELPPEEPASL